MKKILVVLVALSILSLFIIYFMPLYQTIEVSLEGLECRIGQEICREDVTVKIEGKYKNYLFKDDEFKGLITVDGYSFANTGGSVEFIVTDGIGYINYFSVSENGHPDIEPLGGMVFSSNFKEVLLYILEPANSDSKEWNGEDGLFIAAPTYDHESALELAKILSQNSTWLSQVDWK